MNGSPDAAQVRVNFCKIGIRGAEVRSECITAMPNGCACG